LIIEVQLYYIGIDGCT